MSLLQLCFAMVAVLAAQEASARNNPYSYFFRPTYSADAYSSMGDIDWAKRAGFTDTDSPANEELIYAPAQPKRGFSKGGSKWDRAHAGHSRSYYQAPVQAYARYGAITRPQTRNMNGERQSNYFSMADMDWGWKKRSQVPAWFDVLAQMENEGALEDEPRDKKNLAALAKSNLFPYHHYQPGKRAEDDMDDEITEEDKRNIQSLVRQSRSGISSLARNGGVRAQQS